jgi:hypothetical protein
VVVVVAMTVAAGAVEAGAVEAVVCAVEPSSAQAPRTNAMAIVAAPPFALTS